MGSMKKPHPLSERRLVDRVLVKAWETLQNHSAQGNKLQADANRLAFADPEFLLRRETRGIRFQLELLKPDMEQSEQGIENTIVVFGSARFASPEEANAAMTKALASGDAAALINAKRQQRNAHYYDQARFCLLYTSPSPRD